MKNVIVSILIIVCSFSLHGGGEKMHSPYARLSPQEQLEKLTLHRDQIMSFQKTLRNTNLLLKNNLSLIIGKINFLDTLCTYELKQEKYEHLDCLYFIIKNILSLFLEQIFKVNKTFEEIENREKSGVELQLAELNFLIIDRHPLLTGAEAQNVEASH